MSHLYQLWCWTPFIVRKSGFPRTDQNIPYLPSRLVDTALKAAVRFYYIKNDSKLQKWVLQHLQQVEQRQPSPSLPLLLQTVRTIQQDLDQQLFAGNQPFIDPRTRILLQPHKIRRSRVAIFDVRRGWLLDEIRMETYQDIIPLKLDLPIPSHTIQAATHSYSEALAHYEWNVLQTIPAIAQFYSQFLTDLKKWQFPIRLGLWTTARHRDAFLFLWRFKPIREKILNNWKLPLQPRTLLYLPKQRQPVGWCELRDRTETTPDQ